VASIRRFNFCFHTVRVLLEILRVRPMHVSISGGPSFCIQLSTHTNSSAFGSWNVRQKCLAGLSVTFLCPDSFEFYTTPICSRAIPLSVTLVPYNTLFMAYRPNVNGPCHCPWCLNSLHVLGPAIGGSHGPGRYYLFKICPPFRLMPIITVPRLSLDL
jgi:hypothetical protein